MGIKVSMVSLGCSKNQVDAELLLGRIQNQGFELVANVGESDVAIVNTCGFIQAAKEEAIENILELAELKKEGTIKAIIVTGCMAERYKSEIIDEIEEVDAVLGIGSNDEICDAIKKAVVGEKTLSFKPKGNLSMNGERVLTTLPFYAYIKIAEGCDNCCSYCAIPQIRGPFRSRPMEEIITEAKWLASEGVKELIVVAQDTTRYGEDLYGEYKLAALLEELCKIEGFVWIRPLYCYPDKITDELLSVISTQPKVANYLDIPLQHCNEGILRSMNRGMNKAEITALIEKIRAKVEGITLRTTLIAGFPGETEEQFNELCDFVDEMQFDRLGCFAYSAEENTPAAEMENQVDDDVKQKREEIIMTQQALIMAHLNEQKLDTTVRVIVEGFDKFGECYFGRSEADAPEVDGKIFFTSDKFHTMGDFVDVLINEVLDYDLVGTRV